MYKRKPDGWLKHVDFIILDLLSMHLAFVIAFVIRQGAALPYADSFYRNIAIVLSLLYLVVIFLTQSHKGIMRRGYYKELVASVKHVTYIVGLLLCYLFFTQTSKNYSRIIFLIMWVIQIGLTYLFRILWKERIKRLSESGEGHRSLLLLTTSERAQKVIKTMKDNNYEYLKFAGVGIVDKDICGREIEGVSVVANVDNVLNWIKQNWVDEVFIEMSTEMQDAVISQRLVDSCMEMGITVHRKLAKNIINSRNQSIETLAGYTVLSTSGVNMVTTKQLFFKRIIDICGGFVGCILTGIVFLFVAPCIYVKSPGPIFFAQVRVGKNGKLFKIYKFRSMYMDAEERKKELMAQNEMQGFMFKMENDPRIIKGIGSFIRKTSIDELPQFWNVLKGDMSLVGTRPPTLDEWEQYELHHRKRLAIKPGITGMWQVSGRNNITDFEEVVELDTKYILNWSFKLDILILLKTVLIVLKGRGAA